MNAGQLPESSSPNAADHLPAARNIRMAAEVVLFLMVAIAPWGFASITPPWEFAVLAGVAILSALWAAHTFVTKRFQYRTDIVSASLLALILLTVFQLIPLPVSFVRTVSPQLAEWNDTLRPDIGELLPGESEAIQTRRPSWMPLSIEPSATQDFLVRVLAVFLVYAVTRNLIATKESFTRLAWVGFVNGALLALFALVQSFSTNGSVLYWQIVAPTDVFGPFVCKNHYAFYENLCVGLGLGLLLEGARRTVVNEYQDQLSVPTVWDRLFGYIRVVVGGGLRSPQQIILLAGLGLMLVSIPFSLSRGGVLAVAAGAGLTVVIGWWIRRPKASETGRKPSGESAGGTGLVVVGLAVVVLGLAAWFGSNRVVQRVESLWRGTGDNRTPVWREVWPAFKDFPLFGVGGGNLPRAEMAYRVHSKPGTAVGIIVNSAHNEYLEAAVEGGIIRLAITVVLAIGVIVVTISAARRFSGRTIGPYFIGSLYGLTAITIHSIGDFGLHLPAVAVAAAAVAGHVMAAAADTQLKSRRKRSRSSAKRPPEPAIAPPAPALPPRGVVLVGWQAYVAAILVALAGLQVVWDGWRWKLVDRLRLAAGRTIQSDDADRWDEAIRYLEAATRVRPDDAEVWNELAAVHLAAARERSDRPLAAVVGPLGFIQPPPDPLTDDIATHIIPALNAARNARNLSPLIPGPHLRLATYGRWFAQSEPAAVHFARAKRVGRFDPDIWYLSGSAALERGDFDTAWADWRQSLTESPRRLGLILPRATRLLDPEQIRAQILPDNPIIWVAATDYLYPHSTESRRAWLQAAIQRWASPSADAVLEKPESLIAWATANEEVGDFDAAREVWKRARETYPNDYSIRDRFAERLMADEYYKEAIMQLEALVLKNPDRKDYAHRLEAARHALKLKQEIEAP